MELFKINIDINKDLSHMTDNEKINYYSRNIITQIMDACREINCVGLKIFVNIRFASNYIDDSFMFSPLITNGEQYGSLLGRPLHILNELKDDEFFIAQSKHDYQKYLRFKKLNKIIERI